MGVTWVLLSPLLDQHALEYMKGIKEEGERSVEVWFISRYSERSLLFTGGKSRLGVCSRFLYHQQSHKTVCLLLVCYRSRRPAALQLLSICSLYRCVIHLNVTVTTQSPCLSVYVHYYYLSLFLSPSRLI